MIATNPHLTTTVNFLHRKRLETKREKSKQAKVYALSTLAILVYLVLFIPVIAFRMFQSAQVEAIEGEITTKISEIERYKNVETKYTLITHKLDLIESLMSTRTNPKEVLESAVNTLPREITIKQSSFEDAGGVKLTAEAPDVFAVVRLIEALEASIEANNYAYVKVAGMNKSEEGIYTFTLDFSKKSS